MVHKTAYALIWDQITIATVLISGAITTDLRQYLNTRFPKGGVDHELQNTIRDNLYLRTVPVTTRTPRPEERNGIDYTFLSKEEFLALEKSGELLESGIYDGKPDSNTCYTLDKLHVPFLLQIARPFQPNLTWNDQD